MIFFKNFDRLLFQQIWIVHFQTVKIPLPHAVDNEKVLIIFLAKRLWSMGLIERVAPGPYRWIIIESQDLALN